MKVLRCGDQYNWAYNFISREHSRYSMHNISYAKHDEVNLEGVDLIYIHSPDISNYHAKELPLIAKDKGITVIGGYAGNPAFWSANEAKVYSYADLIVTISPQLYQFAKNMYPDTPVVYLPESVDTKFFHSYGNKWNDNFTVGWAGGAHKRIKRCHILNKLDFEVTLMSQWTEQRQAHNQGKQISHEGMRDFYNSIDCLVLTSASECMPRVVMESMACGLPVVATDVGSMRLLLQKELIVPVNPEEDVVKGINACLSMLRDDLSYREAVSAHNLAHAQKWLSWVNNAQLWDDVFEATHKGSFEKVHQLADKWLDNFRAEFDYTLKHSDEGNLGTTEQQYVAVIDYLNAREVNYFALHTTCLDAIRYKSLKVDKGRLFLGINTKVDKGRLENELQKINLVYDKGLYYKGSIQVKVKLLESIVNTKDMPFYNTRIKVPNPVVGYLESKFGKNWELI